MFFFIVCLIVCFLVLHLNKSRISVLQGLIVVAISAIPFLNVLVIPVCLLELALIARNRYNGCEG